MAINLLYKCVQRFNIFKNITFFAVLSMLMYYIKGRVGPRQWYDLLSISCGMALYIERQTVESEHLIMTRWWIMAHQRMFLTQIAREGIYGKGFQHYINTVIHLYAKSCFVAIFKIGAVITVLGVVNIWCLAIIGYAMYWLNGCLYVYVVYVCTM